MAQIPLGNFGGVVAAPQQAVGTPAAATGATQARALGELAQTAGSIATQQMAAQTRLDAKERDVQERTAAAARRSTKLADMRDARAALAQDVAAGKLPLDEAEAAYKERMTSVLEKAGDGLAPDLAGSVLVDLQGEERAGLTQFRGVIKQRRTEINRGNFLQMSEAGERLAATDWAKAKAETLAQMDALGPDAGYGPDDLVKMKQAWVERVAGAHATAVVGQARTLADIKKARETLSSDQFADLDPTKREQIGAMLEGRETTLLQRQALAEERAARQAEAHLNRARSAFEASQARVDAGIPDSDAQVTQTAQALAGTPYLETYKALQVQARQNGGLAAQPIPAQRAHLDALYARRGREGASEALNKQIDSAEKMLAASERDFTEDGLRAYVRRTPGQELPQIDVSSVDGLTRSIGQRLALSQEAQAWAQRPVSPLTSDEAIQAGKMIGILPIDQRSSAIAAISTAIGPQASAALAGQIDKSDRSLALAFQYGAAKTTRDRYVSEIILRGADALKSKSVKVDPTAESGWKAAIAREIGDAYPVPALRDDVREAAFLITAGRAAEEGAVDPKHAVRLAARGGIVEVNGAKIPVDGQIDEGDVERRLQTLTADDLKSQVPGGKVRIGPQVIPLEQFVTGLSGVQLSYAGRPSGGAARYHILAGGRYATDESGRRLIITVQPNAR